MGQPELEFEFDPPDFLRDKASSAQPPKKLNLYNLLKHVTAACVLLAGSIGIVSLFYADVTNDVIMQALGKKKNPRVADSNNGEAADPQILLAKLEEKTTSLSERVAALETNLYRSKAAALGFRNPFIRPVSLAAQPPLPLVFAYPVRGENRLELKIVQITSEAIVVEVTGTAPEAPVKTVKVAQPLKVGIAVELTQGIRLEGMPHVFMTVLEMPSKDTAIIAVGAKEVAQS
jgi:hypothetical protein